MLFLHKVDTNILDNEGRNLLSKSVDEIIGTMTNNDVDFLKYIIKNGVRVNLKDKKGQTALHKAVIRGNLDVVKFLIQQAKADTSIKDNSGRTPLHLVRGKHSENIIKLLLVRDRRPMNEADKFGYTPLNYSAISGDIKAVQCFLFYGAYLTNFAKKHKTMTQKLYDNAPILNSLSEKCESRYRLQIEDLVQNMHKEMLSAF
jgi:ankyrin repeat protein